MDWRLRDEGNRSKRVLLKSCPLAEGKKRSIFPLHMTPFESYMLVDDSPEFPMTFVLVCEFSGEINREAFQQAIDSGLQRHPMLRTNVRPAKSSRDCWVEAEDYDSQVRWGEIDEPIYVEGTGVYLNLRSDIGFRCWCQHDSNRGKLIAVFHHGTCDGIGAYQFLGDVFWFYAKQMGQQNPELSDLDQKDLRKRFRSSVSAELVKIVFDNKQAKRKEADQRLVQPLSTPHDTKSDDELKVYPQLLSHTYNKTEFRDLRLDAQESGQTINDRLLESLFAAASRWNQEFSTDFEAKDFCINMPLDLRLPDNPVFSATNLVTCSLIRRTPAQINDPLDLPSSLREQMMQIKHSRFDSPFMKMLVGAPIDLDDAKMTYSNRECLATAVFSNTGDPTRRFLAELPRKKGVVHFGNLVLEDIGGASPLRYETRVAMNIFTYRRNLRICMRFDPQYFSTDDGKAFLNYFVECFQHGVDKATLPERVEKESQLIS